MSDQPPIERTCRRCGETKPFDQFRKSDGSRWGRCFICSACNSARAVARNRVRVHDMTDAPAERECRTCHETKPLDAFEKNPNYKYSRSYTCRPCAVLRSKRWREENRDRSRAYFREYARDLRKDIPETSSAQKTEWFARERGAEIVETVFPLVVLERDDGVCGICGEDVDPFDYTLDHIEPCRAGGEHSYANIQLAHRACNTRKARNEERAAA